MELIEDPSEKSEEPEISNLDQKLAELRVLTNDRLKTAENEGYLHIFSDEIFSSMANELKVSFKAVKFSVQTKKFAAKKILNEYPSFADNGFDEVIIFLYTLYYPRREFTERSV